MTRTAQDSDCLHQFLEQSAKQLRHLAEKYAGATEMSEKLHQLAREMETLYHKLGGDDDPSLELVDT